MERPFAAWIRLPEGRSRSSSRPSLFRRLVESQLRWSERLDERLPETFRADGNRDFLDRIVPQYLKPGLLVYDVGGGKNPVVAPDLKRQLRLTLAGLDADASELAAAPPGSYDRTIHADILRYRGSGDGDLVICQALLEHVPDTSEALAAISGLLKPGGRALIFLPSRNAMYARINLLLPEGLKRRILFGIFPKMGRDHGFRAYYDRCTPHEIEVSAGRQRLAAEHLFVYFRSDYFRCCFPVHALWRIWVAAFRWIAGDEAAETFTFVFRKLA